MSAAASRRRLNNGIGALTRFGRSRKLDALHIERAGVELNFTAIRVLDQLMDHQPIALGELAKRAHMQPSALSRQVRLLEEGGYIKRSTHADDARIAMVQCTPAGRDARQRMRIANEEMLARQLSGWTETELDHLAEQLERLVADLRRPLSGA